MKIAAVIAAGGTGKRLKARVRKPFVQLCGRPLLAWTLRAFQQARGVDEIVLVIHRRDLAAARRLALRAGLSKVRRIVPGGPTRVASVGLGVKALSPSVRWVAVHDGARPLVTPKLIEATLRAARAAKAATVAVPVIPTVKWGDGRWVRGTLDRNRLWEIQTPQVFDRKLLERAHARAARNGAALATDDASLVQALGCKVRLVPGDRRNLKVTTPEDLVIAQALLKRGQPPSGVKGARSKR